MTQLITYIARALVSEPDQVEVTDTGEDEAGRRRLELRVAEGDRGKVIGKRGRMAHSLRALLAAATEDAPVALEIVD